MLQSFRDNLKGVTAGFIVAIIIVPFALFGIDAIFLSGSSVEKVASVDGESITELRLQQAVNTRKQQIMDQFGDIDPALLDDEQLRGPVLKSLVRQKAVTLGAKSEDMGVADKTLYDLILSAPVFQTDGKFDRDRFTFVIRQMGYTTTSYNDMLRDEILLNQFARGVMSTAFLTEKELSTLAAISEQTRNFYYLTIPLEPVLAQVEATEEEIAKYYEDHPDLFQEEEKVRVEYIELTPEDLIDQVEVNEEAIRQAYAAKVEELKSISTREVAHILIEPGDKQETQAKIAEIQQKLADGEDFAELAETYSEDPGSADQGGLLGVMSPGAFPEEFEAAVEALKKGEVSAPVVTEAGTHFIKVLNVNRAEIPEYEELRGKLLADLQKQQAVELLPGKLDELKEVTYNAETLSTVAEQLQLDAEISDAFGRQGGEGIARFPLVARTAFSDDVLENKYPSEALELGDEHFVVIKLKDHLPAHRLPLEDVKAEIAKTVSRNKAAEALESRAREILARVDAGEDIETVAKSEKLEWQVSLDTKRFGGNVDGEIRQEIFALPASEKLPKTGLIAKNNGDRVVYNLVAIAPGEAEQLSISEKAGLRYSSVQDIASRELSGYEATLLADADVEVKGD